MNTPSQIVTKKLCNQEILPHVDPKTTDYWYHDEFASMGKEDRVSDSAFIALFSDDLPPRSVDFDINNPIIKLSAAS